MDEGKFVADFVAANLEKIFGLGKKAYGKIDGLVQIGLKTAYTEYLINTRLKYSKSKSFFIRSQPVELYSYYVPTGIVCGNKTISKPSFKNCIEFTNRVVISGSGGTGKSVLIKHLFLNCIQTKEYAPILVELRDLNAYEKNLDEFITETLDAFGFKTSETYVTTAKESGHFSFFFDGLDEVTPSARGKLIRQILSLSKKYPLCPIFLSSRPDDTLDGLDDFSTFRMNPLVLDEALSLVEKLPYEKIIKDKFRADLSGGLFEKHKSFLSNPLLLSIMLLTYGENAEIPTKLSIFYNQAFEALFHRHDANKGGYSRKRKTGLDIQDFSKVFSLFCLQTYEKRILKMPRTQCLELIEKSAKNLGFDIRAEDYLDDLLSAACLMIEDGLEIAFSHRTFQEYFVALRISASPPDIQTKLIERYWKNLAWDNVFFLLREINPELVERELIVPRLEELFKTIGVKRTVGITHLVRYLKHVVSAIIIDPEAVSVVIQSGKGYERALVSMAVRNYSGYVFAEKEDMKKHVAGFCQKFSKLGRKVEYKSKLLTIRSPMLIDLNSHGMGFSVAYLSAAFDAYKKLKAKHLNTLSSFDALLGIK